MLYSNGMRPEVQRLVSLGPLSAEACATVAHLKRIDVELRAIARPLSDSEAIALIGLLGLDGCFGIASSLFHRIESAPSWPLRECLLNSSNEFVVSLRTRAQRGGLI